MPLEIYLIPINGVMITEMVVRTFVVGEIMNFNITQPEERRMQELKMEF